MPKACMVCSTAAYIILMRKPIQNRKILTIYFSFVCRGSLPVLLQGETSVGKTSLITYLAGRVGQICHRINNHEHTDLQTYLGAYTASSATCSAVVGNETLSAQPLVFQEGIFVQAMRKGHWIILDELNLAPTEILEALNRVGSSFPLQHAFCKHFCFLCINYWQLNFYFIEFSLKVLNRLCSCYFYL